VGDACLAVDMAFDPSGFAIFGQDVPYGTGNIQRVDLSTGVVSTIMRLPGISFSALRLRDGVWLIGTAYGAGTAYVPGDLNVHLFASIDGGETFTDVYDTPYLDSNSYALKVQFAYPNGDFPIQVAGAGTVVAHIDETSTATATTAATTMTAANHNDGRNHNDRHNHDLSDHGGFDSGDRYRWNDIEYHDDVDPRALRSIATELTGIWAERLVIGRRRRSGQD
jgi:hypothetical protein